MITVHVYVTTLNLQFISLFSGDVSTTNDPDMNGHYPPPHYPAESSRPPPCPREMYGQDMYSTIGEKQVGSESLEVI